MKLLEAVVLHLSNASSLRSLCADDSGSGLHRELDCQTRGPGGPNVQKTYEEMPRFAKWTSCCV